MPHFHVISSKLGFDDRAWRQWSGVAIRSHAHASQSVDGGETTFGQIEGLGSQRHQIRPFVEHRCAYRFRPTIQEAPLILLAALLQVGVQLFQITRFRQRHPVVAAEVSALTFDAALLVATCRIAELALKAPVRTEADEAAGLLPLISMQDLLTALFRLS